MDDHLHVPETFNSTTAATAASVVVVEEEDLLAPENFSMVEEGVYRSAFPRTKHCRFLASLNLKHVVPLVPEDYPEAMCAFYEKNDITLHPSGLDGNKWPFKGIDLEAFRKVVSFILDPTNRPLLVHCNKGKHRTGCVIACLRKVRGWAFSAVSAEYLLFSHPKSRIEDQRFIESFELEPFEMGEDEVTVSI